MARDRHIYIQDKLADDEKKNFLKESMITNPRFLPLDIVHSGKWILFARARIFLISSTDPGLDDAVSAFEYATRDQLYFTHQTAAEGKFFVCGEKGSEKCSSDSPVWT